jgi:[protein-PII] uridylyltransferase
LNEPLPPETDDPTAAGLLDPRLLEGALTAGGIEVAPIRELLKAGRQEVVRRFRAGEPVAGLVRQLASLVDRVAVRLWTRVLGPDGDAATLVAGGGYGRRELLPGSDVDLMVLLEERCADRCRQRVEQYLTLLWDVGLEVGHSVRTVADCEHEAARDLTVITNLMESRRLAGSHPLYARMRAVIAPERLWPSPQFFAAKLAEQQARHREHDDALYNLEPNVKEGPGGLRDIQLIAWVLKRHFGADDLADLVRNGFLTRRECTSLIEAQNFLWRVRFALHALAARREDRLLFHHQQTLAREFGYRDDARQLAVEQFMKDYYRCVQEVARLTEMLLQLFQEAILHAEHRDEITPINSRFRARNGYLEVTGEHVFRRYPFALLEVFLVLQENPWLEGVRAATIRLIRDHRHLIDDAFRRDIRNRSLFLELMRQPRGITHELRRMHRYGVLAAYLPAFGSVVGQMQHDLFHVYTVDEHILVVVRNLRRMAVPRFFTELPLASELMQRLPKPELVYLAGLFHDIAKGRGGDHSELGALDAMQFCLDHDLSAYDARLVSWLVRHHLTMSRTAQREDVSDPEVVTRFAALVGDEVHLNYLYVLTVADIRGTNPRLWNSWRDVLLRELYSATLRTLRRGLGSPIDKADLIAETQDEVWRRLTELRRGDVRVTRLWASLPEDYFVRHTPDEIARHARAVLYSPPGDLPLVEVRPRGDRGGTEVLVVTHDRDYLFASATTVMDRLGLSIQDARIITSGEGLVLDTFIVLDSQGRPVEDRAELEAIAGELRAGLGAPSGAPPAVVSRRPERRLRHFSVPTDVRFRTDRPGRTVMEVVTSDRPGLLARLAVAMAGCGVRLHSARIATYGERVEDFFFVTGPDGAPLGEQSRERLRGEVLRALSEP